MGAKKVRYEAVIVVSGFGGEITLGPTDTRDAAAALAAAWMGSHPVTTRDRRQTVLRVNILVVRS